MSKRIFLSLSALFLCNTTAMHNVAIANNTSYIMLSAQIAREKQLGIVANNIANSNTNGFQQDAVIFKKFDYKNGNKKKNSFVYTSTTYKQGDLGGLKVTNNPLDIAVGGYGYFKISTPKGPRYTLDGALTINNQNILVNMSGYPIANQDGDIIEIPENFQSISITSDGSVFVDNDKVSNIGVFGFTEQDPFIKEGDNLYSAKGQEFLLEDYNVISGAIRLSNVNSTVSMAQMVELQRAFGATGGILSDSSEMEKLAINKLPTK